MRRRRRVVAEQRLVADPIDEEAGRVDAHALQIERGAERGLEEIEMNVRQLEVIGIVGDGVEFEAVALVLES